MHFAHPFWIFIGLAIAIGLSLLFRSMLQERQRRLEHFAGHHLASQLTQNLSASLRRTKALLLVAAVLSLCIAMAGPRYGYRWVEVKRKGIDILFALDTSKSMLAQDLKPSRLERAKLGILDFIEGLNGDRVGLLPFAGSSYLMTPLTLDYSAFETSLHSVNTATIPHGGTNITQVIAQARKVLHNDANHKLLLLLTDGEDLKGDAIEAARKAKEDGVTIYTVGVGTEQGELIPQAGGHGFVKDANDKYVTTRLDTKTLTAIAEATGGMYAPLGNNGEGLARIYQEKLSLIPKEELAERKQRVPLERFGWPLALAIFLLLLEYLLPERKPSRKKTLPNLGKGKKSSQGLAVFLLLLGLFPQQAKASPGEEAFQNGDYATAIEHYSAMLEKQPDAAQIHYNLGSAAYKNNQFDQAIASFSTALKTSDLSLQHKIYYNRGNALFKQGEQTEQEAPQKTLSSWEQAIDSFEGALQLDANDTLATENLAFVNKKLEELKKKLEKQNQQNQKNSQQQENKDEQEKNNSHDEQQKEQQNNDNESDKKKDPEEKQSANEDTTKQPQDQNSGQPETDQDDQKKKQEQQSKTPQHKEKNHQEQQPTRPQQGQNKEQAEQQGQGSQKAETAGQGQEKNIAAAQQQGNEKMNQEEAERLLHIMKNSEGELLHFIPRSAQQAPETKDW